MPFLGQGSTVGRRNANLAGFPTSGLVALYKCDELTGNTLSDTMGYLPDLTPASGVALDCATQTQCLIDGTGLRALVSGAAALCAFGFELITPALASGTTQVLLGAVGTSVSQAPGVRMYLTQTASFGYADDRYTLTVVGRLNIDAAGSTAYTVTLGTADFDGFVAETAYQMYGKFICKVGTPPTLYLYYRPGVSGPWRYIVKAATGTPSTSAVFVEGASSSGYRVAAEGTLGTTNPFKGRLVTALFALGELDLDDVRDALLSVDKGEAQRLLPDAARYWQFGTGSGAAVDEFITDAAAAITGTPAWSTALTTTTQLCLGQGNTGGGKWGIALGGEGSFALSGQVATSTAMTAPIIQGNTGWTLIACLRVGDELPAAERTLVSLYGPLSDGNEETDATLVPGVHFNLTAAGAIIGRYKRRAIADATVGTQIDLGAGTRYAANGVFTVYAISCDSAGAIASRRIGFYDTSVTAVATATASAANFLNRAVRVRIGDASLDCDLVAGPVAIYNRKLTDSEIEQFRNRCLGRMAGLPSYVDAAAAADGNGTERWPYASLQSALRVHQPAGTIYLNGGAANSRIDTSYVASSALRPASHAGMELIGSGNPVIVSTLGDTNRPPTLVESAATGVWIFRGITFDATDAGVNHAPGYTDGRCSSAAQFTGTGIERLEMYDCTVKNAAKADESSGTGLTVRAKDVRIYNLTCTDNEEHGMYARINADSEAVTHSLLVDGFVCTGGGEDGLKVTNEFSDGGTSGGGGVDGTRPAVYFTVDINDVRVVGGKNQLNLLGIASGYVTNCLLEGSTTAPLLNTGGILIGSDSYTGYMVVSNVLFANITIRDYNTGTYGKAVNNVNSTGCTAYNIITEGCLLDLNDPDGTLTSYYCSGNCGDEDGLWPEGNSNQPDATITFAGAGPGTADAALDPASDGYEDGVNLWTTATNLRTNLAGAARSEAGAWSRGAI